MGASKSCFVFRLTGVIFSLQFVLIVFTAFSCTGDETFVLDGNTEVVTGIEINKDETIILVGGSERLYANVLPINAEDKSVHWESKDPGIAFVDNRGLVSGEKVGITEISARSNDGDFIDACEVIIKDIPVRVTGISFLRSAIVISVGNESRLQYEIQPGDATNQNIIWESSDPSIAAVDQRGSIEGIKKGITDISVTTVDGQFSAICSVTVD